MIISQKQVAQIVRSYMLNPEPTLKSLEWYMTEALREAGLDVEPYQEAPK